MAYGRYFPVRAMRRRVISGRYRRLVRGAQLMATRRRILAIRAQRARSRMFRGTRRSSTGYGRRGLRRGR